MKQHLLLTLAVGLSGAMIAQAQQQAANLTPSFENLSVAAYSGTELSDPIPFYNAKPINNTVQPQQAGGNVWDENVIGTTYYDSQTNGSPYNRIVLNSDGSISAAWIFSSTAGTYPTTSVPVFSNRGTGYNYFDGNAWAAQPTSNIEAGITGFTNIAATSAGEVVVSHNGSAGQLVVSTRATKGTGAWSTQTLNFTGIFARAGLGGSDGKSIHIISEAVIPTSNLKTYVGYITYTRSKDFGVTWDKENIQLPELGASFYRSIYPDSYSMDVNGNNVAIVVGEPDKDVVLLKSTDNGDTWTKTVVNPFPIPLWNPFKKISDADGNGIADTISSNDGNVVVRLDNQGKAHIAFGNMTVSCNDTLIGMIPSLASRGLLYWNENMGSSLPILIADLQDLDGDGKFDGDTTSTSGSLKWGRFSTSSTTSMPSIAFDANNNIYVSYCALKEGEPFIDQKSVRHVYVIRSDNGGNNWTYPLDVVGDEYAEGVFATLASRVDAKFHLIYQRDAHPGSSLANTNKSGTITYFDPLNQGENNEIVYVSCDRDVLLTWGIKETTAEITNITVYPNPASEVATVVFDIAKPGNVVTTVSNIVGQTVATYKNDFTFIGNYRLAINVSDYQPGVYVVTTSVDGKSISKKLIVE